MIVIKVALTIVSSHQTASSQSHGQLVYNAASVHVRSHALYDSAYTWQSQGGALCSVWDAHMGSVIPLTETAVPFYYNWFRSVP